MKISALRGGAATVFYPIWHLEVESLLVLKNNRGVEDNRARHLDYGVQLNKLMYQRFLDNKEITLFSPHQVKDLYVAFFADQDKFEELYLKYEKDETIMKRVVNARELFTAMMNERASTGRIYIQNVDHSNSHGAFIPSKAPIQQSNLCVSGDTKILTKDGNIKISSIVGQTVEIWNGEEWSEVEVVQTSISSPLWEVELEDGRELNCTEYHKWYVKTPDGMKEIRTHELEIGMELIDWKHQETGETVKGGVVEWVSDTPYSSATYCVNEPKKHMVVFNGILTGQCLEIELPTSPVSAKNPDEGEIALCTLAAVNVGNIETTKDIEERMDLLVRLLDEILDYQNYPVKAAEKGGRARRSLGIGVINFAYYLTKNWAGYNEKGIDLTHELFEAIQYYGLKTSVELAKEKGKCEWFEDTKYSQGILPIDTYKKELDEVCKTQLKLDWEALRQDILKYGLRNSTITAQMPSESSSTVSNSTNGIEPPRGLVTVKANKEGIVKQVVPDIETFGSLYPLTWKLEDNKGYITLVAVIQKFVDQAISANTNYDPKKFPNGKVPMGQMMKDLLLCYKLGVKTLYYHNTRDGNDDNQNDIDDCEGGACKI